MMPAMARKRHVAVESRMAALAEFSNTTPLTGLNGEARISV